MYVYLHAGDRLYTVGFFDPRGVWNLESNHRTAESAARRVNYLNGGNASLYQAIIGE
jgi:hypothetical protein